MICLHHKKATGEAEMKFMPDSAVIGTIGHARRRAAKRKARGRKGKGGSGFGPMVSLVITALTIWIVFF